MNEKWTLQERIRQETDQVIELKKLMVSTGVVDIKFPIIRTPARNIHVDHTCIKKLFIKHIASGQVRV